MEKKNFHLCEIILEKMSSSSLNISYSYEFVNGVFIVNFQFYSPRSRDFSFDVEVVPKDNMFETFAYMANEVCNYIESFDISYETYIWLDNTGHGKNGAPYELSDVLNDTLWCNKKLLSIYEFLVKDFLDVAIQKLGL